MDVLNAGLGRQRILTVPASQPPGRFKGVPIMAARKITTASKAKAKVSAPVSSTPVRNTSLPPRASSSATASAKKFPPTYDQIALRAFSIWQSGKGGSQEDNWFRAERELRGA